MNYFEKAIIKYIGKENFNKIQAVTIGIAGAGGLGSNCAFNLIRSGFKNLLLVDFDIVDYSNINRQFYFYEQIGILKVTALRKNLLAINPNAEIKVINVKLERENIYSVFKDCDIIVEAFDKAPYKKMLFEEFYLTNKFIVLASGLAGWGNSDTITTNKIKDNIYIIGDRISEISNNSPPISPRVNIAAAKQADIILEYVLKDKFE